MQVEQRVLMMRGMAAKNAKLLALVVEHQEANPECSKMLVFVNKRYSVEALARVLSNEGHMATLLHGGLDQSEREEAIATLQMQDHAIVVATDVAARGLDVKDLV